MGRMSTHTGYHRIKGPWQPSAAQQRVLDGVAAGESNNAIAARLGLSTETVKWHVSELLAETGCADRTELAGWWQGRQHGGVGNRTRVVALVLALAALLVIGLALVGGVLLVIAAHKGARSHSAVGHRFVAPKAATPTAPAEAAVPTSIPGTPAPPPDQPDPASSANGNGPVVFLWAGQRLQLSAPNQLAVDAQDNLYVVDSGNSRIVKFDSNGNMLTAWGSPGSGDGQFSFLHAPGFVSGLAVDAQGIVYVVDDSDRLQRFDSNGAFLGRWPGSGPVTGSGQLARPNGLAIDRQGRLYIADCGGGDPLHDRVQQFTAEGTLLAAWGTKGAGLGQFDCPSHPAFDAAGNLYVVDRYNNRLQKLDDQGHAIGGWGRYDAKGGEFNHPANAAVDARGNVYVTDNYNHRVEKFDSQGNFLGEWGSHGTGDGRFAYPAGIAIDSHGDIYIGDLENGRIEKFRPR